MTQKSRFPIWHPFTQHAIMSEMTNVVRGEGAYLETNDGRKFFDAISSWWVITHGHRHPWIVQAIKDQADRLDQVIFAGHTHDPAEKLAAGLLEMTPDSLRHVFFSDSGSTAVEVALKMALGYWKHIDQPEKNRIVVMEGSYHGDTIGTMSVGQRGVYNAAYAPLLFDVIQVPFPSPGGEQDCINALDAAGARGDVAGFIVEPLVLGAGGMLMYQPEMLAKLADICKSHDVLFIADEVMTGWGRSGKLFACETAGVQPDIACYAKGITGGSMPLAVTMCAEKIFDAHYSADRNKTFFHSSSYTANPIACAAAVANLQIWRDEPVRDRLNRLAAMQTERLATIKTDGRFKNLRQCGTITAMDLHTQGTGYLAEVGPVLYAFFQSRNMLLRPLGNTIYVMPPYCSTADDLDRVYETILDGADHIKSALG